MVDHCLWCGTELPFRDDGRATRRYCTASHRQLAYIARLPPAEALARRIRKAAATRRTRDIKRRF